MNNTTIIWDCDFNLYSAVIADGVFTETLGTGPDAQPIARYSMARTPAYDSHPSREFYTFEGAQVDGQPIEYSSGPIAGGAAMVAWIDGAAYTLTDDPQFVPDPELDLP